MAKLTEAQIIKAVELRRGGMTLRDVAKELGAHHTTVMRALTRYQPSGGMKGAPPSDPLGELIDKTDVDGTISMMVFDRPPTVEELMEAAGLDRELWIPQFVKVNTWQGFYKLKTPEGHKKVNLYQTKVSLKRIMSESVQEVIHDFVARHSGRPIPKPKLPKWKKGEYISDEPFLLTWGIYDAHLGMYAWNSEVGASYDMSIARNRIYNSIDDTILELRPYKIGKVIVPVGNDFLHCDSARQTTAFGDHHLDVDTRYAKILLAGVECMAYQTERALEIAEKVELLYIPGNHDYNASYAVTVALAERYRNDPRVSVDLGASTRKFRLNGGVLLGFDHGQKLKKNQTNNIFSTETIKMFSASTCREMHIGHMHQENTHHYESSIPTNGLTIRVHPQLGGVDKWHHDGGLIGQPVKSVLVCRYDEFSHRGTHLAWARDDGRK